MKNALVSVTALNVELSRPISILSTEIASLFACSRIKSLICLSSGITRLASVLINKPIFRYFKSR